MGMNFPNRLQRHFATFAVVFPSEEALFAIYNTILSDHLKVVNLYEFQL